MKLILLNRSNKTSTQHLSSNTSKNQIKKDMVNDKSSLGQHDKLNKDLFDKDKQSGTVSFTSVYKIASGGEEPKSAPSDFSDARASLQIMKLEHKLRECEMLLIKRMKEAGVPKEKLPTPHHSNDDLKRWDGYYYERLQLLKQLKKCERELKKYEEV